jgi:AcrR family transcriptional regulator
MTAVRADAVRNRAKVLEAAREIFAEKGGATTTEDVAKRAGVGIGTVFRHFPTKAALFEALIADRFETLADFADEAEQRQRTKGEAFFLFLERMVKDGPAKRTLLDELVASGVDVKKRILESPAKLRVKLALEKLLGAAQKAGVVRKDIETRDVYAVLAGAAAAWDQSADSKSADRALRLVLDALRVHR